MGRIEGFWEGVSVGLDVGGKVGHSLQPAQTVNPHLISQEAGLEKQNASQSHTQFSSGKFSYTCSADCVDNIETVH